MIQDNTEARAREVMRKVCADDGWDLPEPFNTVIPQQTVIAAMLAYGNERAAQEREAIAAQATAIVADLLARGAA